LRSYQAQSRAANAAFDEQGYAKLMVMFAFDLADVWRRKSFTRLVIVSDGTLLVKSIGELQQHGVEIELVFFQGLCPELRRIAQEWRDMPQESLEQRCGSGDGLLG
jgi:hypothetical protein